MCNETLNFALKWKQTTNIFNFPSRFSMVLLFVPTWRPIAAWLQSEARNTNPDLTSKSRPQCYEIVVLIRTQVLSLADRVERTTVVRRNTDQRGNILWHNTGALHRVNARPLTLVLLRFLSLSFFTFVASSSVFCSVEFPEDGDRGRWCNAVMWTLSPLLCKLIIL